MIIIGCTHIDINYNKYNKNYERLWIADDIYFL